MKLLHIDSSVLGGQSVSRQLTASIVARLRDTTPGLEVSYRDVVSDPVPNNSDEVLEQFLAADIVVVGAPMYNFGIPSQLKAWIDCLAVAGKTFRYSESGAEGLAGDKRIIVASSRGGIYSAPSPLAVLDHQESYLKGFFGFIGVQNVEFVRAEGVNLGGAQRQQALDSALAEVALLQAA